MSRDFEHRIRNVTAVLGPTNTGKTHLAIERMLGHQSGLIGLPLRLLAREVYDRIVARVGADAVALVTGEEKIKPERARYFVCTVEAMPREADVDFLAVDEVQLAADPERGHVFTDRLLHVRGKHETLLLGAQTMRETIAGLIPGANFISRPRLSKLTYAGEKKITRLPPRSAVVAFSAAEVYAIAELMRRQRGGAAVVLGALSPRTRNAQVALYQSGDVDFLVATDAIGMGLNLNVDHVAFAGARKFDGQVHRDLIPSELAQIAGRAGRHMNDGTFGTTAGVEPFSADVIERLESHTFDNVKSLQWRTRELDFGSLDALRDSLRAMPREMRLTRARMADDTTALEAVSHDREVAAFASSRRAIERLWDVCQVPDYRKISTQDHSELVATLYKFLMSPEGRIPVDWFAKQVAFADRTDGDIDTLSTRIAHIRTWTFVSNRADWLADPEHWQGRTRAIEDALSDALHEQLTQRFIDRRTSALMRGLKDKDELVAEIADDGGVQVASHFVGRLQGFRFTPDTQAEGIHGKATRNAAAHVLVRELGMRARRVGSAKSDAFKLNRHGHILWRDEEIARLEAGDSSLKPLVAISADEHLSAPDKEKVQERLSAWVSEIIGERLKPLVEIAAAQDISGLARGIAFRLLENFGSLRREDVAEEMRALDQPARGQLRAYGVRFGAFNIYFPVLLKPASAELALVLWTLDNGQSLDSASLPEPPRAGLTSLIPDAAVPAAFYRVAGFHLCGTRAVRFDMLERLADLIRPLVAWRSGPDKPDTPPKGATGDGGFRTIPEMMSILGTSANELGGVLQALGFRLERVRIEPSAEAPPSPDAAPADAATADVVPADAVPADLESEPASAETAPAQVADTVTPAASDGPEAAPILAEPAPADQQPPPEAKWDEIWRPRRPRGPAAGRQGRPPRRPQQATAKPRQDEPREPMKRDGRPPNQRDRRERRREGPPGGGGRRPERPLPYMQSAGPGPKAGVDPDSPFAALRQLKAAMEKPSQE
jgi:ATP-dependent RNA helicase SUPV3L1/SUV3